MSSQKAQPLTKDEVMMLVELIEAYPIIFSKGTTASNNQLKDATWIKLTGSFNSMIASNPRKPEQLRLKWENLKKTARKRSIKIRMNNLKTGGGKPDYIPPDEALDKVAAILGLTCGKPQVKPRIPNGPKKMIFSSAQNKGKLKLQTAAKASVIARNQAIAEYYQAKKEQEEAIATLEKRKLELEILVLERRICPDP